MAGNPPVAKANSGAVLSILGYNQCPAVHEAQGEVTQLLRELRRGQPEAESRLIELVYVELKRLVRNYLRRERTAHTLEVTDLVHEMYLRVARADEDWRNRAHFFATRGAVTAPGETPR